MDLVKEFKTRSVPSACKLLNDYSNDLFLSPGSLSIDHAKTLHSALPAILTQIFGAPATRGWAQTEIPTEHDASIVQVLKPDGPFVQGLVYLSKFPEYSYDVATESLPDDVRKALAAGAIQYLPRLYTNCTYMEKRTSSTNTTDIRTAATRQSTIFPRSSSGEYQIRFTTIQFYLFYITSVATWVPLMPSPPRPTPVTQSHSIVNRMHPQQPITQQEPIRVRSIVTGAYSDIIDLYLRHFIPCVTRGSGQQDFLPNIGTFLLDACIELWLRTPWISFGQKLSAEYMHCITRFITFLVNDGYLQVISLWSIWAAPWRLGTTPRSFENETYRPIAEGWRLIILDNLLFYIPLVEIFLQPPVQQQSQNDDTKIGGQLRIICRLINVLKAQELTQFLALSEQALVNIHKQRSHVSAIPSENNNDAGDTLANKYFGDQKDAMWNCLKKTRDDLVQLGGGTWAPPHLYIKEARSRAEPLTKTLGAIQDAILSRQEGQLPWAAATAVVHVRPTPAQQKTKQQAAELQKTANAFANCFSVTQILTWNSCSHTY
ncbi:hypothetical protein K492DRAFT_126632 [Lichtheimia hyalospora FSU 10163]|nr:hypothetical protein K492DRAFT_126632 [Lichtheimia hyalospora FSU 10163]